MHGDLAIMTTPLPQTTLRLVKEKPQSSYELKEVSLPALQGDELLVKVGKVALCGTDISLYQWNTGEIHRILCILIHTMHIGFMLYAVISGPINLNTASFQVRTVYSLITQPPACILCVGKGPGDLVHFFYKTPFRVDEL